jgi:flagellar biosynthesis/type III secretory pathway protein FliH
MSPEDVAIVASIDHLLPGRVVTIVGDPAIERGGAVVQVGSCRIDGRVEPALARVRDALGLVTP